MTGFGAQSRERELQEWIAEGIITPAQAARIRDARARHAGPGVFTLLASLGGICVALGVILVVAYNWDRFHRGLKLGGFLLALTLTAEAARRLPDTWAFVRGATQVLWLFLPLAGIGLMGQVYQLSGEPLRPLLVALALGAPVAWYAGNPIAAFLHVAGIAAAAFVGAFHDGTWLSLVEGQTVDGRTALTLYGPRVLGLLALWALVFREAERLLGAKTRRLALLALLAFVWVLTIARTPVRVNDLGGQYLVVGALIALFQAGRRGLGLIDDATAGWGTFMEFAALFSATFLWHTYRYEPRGLDGGALAVLALLLTAAVAATLLGRREGRSSAADMIQRALALSPALIGLLLLAGAGAKPVAVVANVLALALAAQELAGGTATATPGRISFGIVMLGLIIVIRFLDYFGTMLQSGVAFIVAGLGFIALAWVLNKGRTALIRKAEERP